MSLISFSHLCKKTFKLDLVYHLVLHCLAQTGCNHFSTNCSIHHLCNEMEMVSIHLLSEDFCQRCLLIYYSPNISPRITVSTNTLEKVFYGSLFLLERFIPLIQLLQTLLHEVGHLRTYDGIIIFIIFEVLLFQQHSKCHALLSVAKKYPTKNRGF